MSGMKHVKLQFGLKTFFVLALGIAIGFALNVRTLQLLLGPPSEANITKLPTYVVEPPDVLKVDISWESGDQSPSTSGEHLVGPDGTIRLGVYGTVYVAGKTLDEVQQAISRKVAKQVESPSVFVNVMSYNSKVYYLITKNAAIGDSITQLPITGNETALDALAQLGGPSPAHAKIWIARPASNGVGDETILPVDWEQIAGGASTETNYQLFPGDRVFIETGLQAVK